MADGDPSYMLTTVDNPWNPWTHYDEWWAYDRAHGYDTAGYLARMSNVSMDLPESEMEAEIQRAIDEIVRINPSGMFRRVTEGQAIIPAQGVGGGVLAK